MMPWELFSFFFFKYFLHNTTKNFVASVQGSYGIQFKADVWNSIGNSKLKELSWSHCCFVSHTLLWRWQKETIGAGIKVVPISVNYAS